MNQEVLDLQENMMRQLRCTTCLDQNMWREFFHLRNWLMGRRPTALYDLICRVCYLSIETQKIIDNLPEIRIDGKPLSEIPHPNVSEAKPYKPQARKHKTWKSEPPMTPEELEYYRDYHYWWYWGRRRPKVGDYKKESK